MPKYYPEKQPCSMVSKTMKHCPKCLAGELHQEQVEAATCLPEYSLNVCFACAMFCCWGQEDTGKKLKPPHQNNSYQHVPHCLLRSKPPSVTKQCWIDVHSEKWSSADTAGELPGCRWIDTTEVTLDTEIGRQLIQLLWKQLETEEMDLLSPTPSLRWEKKVQ